MRRESSLRMEKKASGGDVNNIYNLVSGITLLILQKKMVVLHHLSLIIRQHNSM
jgi:hypothetical protein